MQHGFRRSAPERDSRWQPGSAFGLIAVAAVVIVWAAEAVPRSAEATGQATRFRSATYPTADAVYPSDVGFYNVRRYGARGDGVTDDTAAAKAAMMDALEAKGQRPNSVGIRHSTVYFPAGTYLVSDSLMWMRIPSDPARITTTVNGGAITGFTVAHGGSGYAPGWDKEGGLWLTGGGGSGVVVPGTVLSDGSVTSVDMQGKSTVGQGYTSAPVVQAVTWRAFVRFEGQNKANTVIRLKDRAPGFTDPNVSISTTEGLPRPNAKAVLYAASETGPNATGAGEDGYANDVWNLTVDVGRGNPGAVAIDWIGSNRASIRNVNIVSEDGAGRCGLNISRNVGGGGGGPAYVKNVRISGFDVGIDADSAALMIGYTFEYIDLVGQRVCGVLNNNMPDWFRQVASSNAVPVFVNRGAGSVAIVDGRFTDGSTATSAIVNEAAGAHGLMFARNIVTYGYRSALANGPEHSVVPGSRIAEFAFPPPVSLFPSKPVSLDLPASNTPEWTDNNFAHWADVSRFGKASEPDSGSDAAAGIQAAMDSGKPVIFFPSGTYKIGATIHVPGTVRKILGCNSFLVGTGKADTGPLFSFDSCSGKTVEFRNFLIDKETAGRPAFLDNGSSDLVIADVFNAVQYRNTPRGTGRLFLENDAIIGLNTFTNQTVYARQWNVECGETHNEVNGGVFWCLGFKSEGPVRLWEVRNATFELLGAFASGYRSQTTDTAFHMTDSRFSLSDVSVFEGWPNLVSETCGGVTRTLPRNGAWPGGSGIGLFAAQPDQLPVPLSR